MIKHLTLTLTFLFTAISFVAGVGHGSSLNDDITFTTHKLPDLAIQQELRQQQAWQDFKAKNKNWYVEFNELTGFPHRAFGKPIALRSGGDLAAASLDFLRSSLSGFAVRVDDLELTRISQNKGYHYLDFKQNYQGLEVLFSRVTLRINQTHEVLMFGTDVFNPAQVNTTPNLTGAEAIAYASNALRGKITGSHTGDLKILPVPHTSGYQFHLVYETWVETLAGSIPGKYYTLVDAHSGELLYRQNEVKFGGGREVSMHLEATVHADNPYVPVTVHPVPNARVVVGGNTSYTDHNGDFSPGTSSTVNAQITLRGLWSRVVLGAQGTSSPSFNATLNDGSNLVSFDNDAVLEERTAYYHVNVIHDYMKMLMPNFTGMDFELLTRVNIDDPTGCNAYYDGNSINFFSSNQTCNAFALVGDICYHEYGHGISDYFYRDEGTFFQNGALGEGYSDLWAMSITEKETVGEGMSTTSSSAAVRRYDFWKKIYPDDIVGEVHADGEIIAGAWMTLAGNLGDIQQMAQIFADHYYGLPNGPNGSEGQVFRDALLEALIADDDDGDLSNGTPNDETIACSFAEHGINMVPDTETSHTEVPVYFPFDEVEITFNVDISQPWYFKNNRMVYRTGSQETWDTLDVSLNDGEYQALIPAQDPGTVITYYFIFDNLCGGQTTFPDRADFDVPNIPYHTLVGFELIEIQDFDYNQGNWTIGDASDNATTGIWEIGAPTPSYLNPGNPSPETEIQPGTDHTLGSGNMCAFTGNAGVGDGMGTNDIDGGETTLFSPFYDLSEYEDPAFEFYRWYTNDQGNEPLDDDWKVYISNDNQDWIEIENTNIPDKSWRRFAFKVKDYITLNNTVRIKFVAADHAPGSLVEAAIDDLALYDFSDKVNNLAEPEGSFRMRVFPNPSRSDFVLMLDAGDRLFDIELINSLGQVVFLQRNAAAHHNKVIIPTGGLSSGLYIVKVKSGDDMHFREVILNREK